MNNRNRVLVGLGLGVMILVAILATSILLINLQQKEKEPIPYGEAFSILSVNTSLVKYRGDPFDVFMSFNVTGYNVTVTEVSVRIQKDNRQSHATTLVNRTFLPGIHQIEISFLPGIWAFEEDQFFALSDGNYSFVDFNLSYIINQKIFEHTYPVGTTFSVIDYKMVNMFSVASWSFSEGLDGSSDGGSRILLSSSKGNFTNSRLNTTVNFTGAYQFLISANTTINGTLYLDSNNYSIAGLKTQLNVADIIGILPVVLVFNSSSSQIELNFTLVNKKKILLLGVADDNWIPTFQNHQEILDEVNVYFEKWFNVTFVVAIVLPVQYSGSTFLPEAFDFAINEFGSRLKLPNNQWDHRRGRSSNNMGLDILLFNTNKTMSNYGMVIGDGEGGFNMAANTGGSLKANGFRLQPSWADNLFQHELSHIFGAPDRKTGEAPPSIMTKSETLEDLLNDLAGGTLWLEINNWLAEDLLKMATQFVFYENIESS